MVEIHKVFEQLFINRSVLGVGCEDRLKLSLLGNLFIS